MRKTLRTNLAYDDVKRRYYVSFCSEESGTRVRCTRTYPTLAEAERALARSAAADAPSEELTLARWLRCWLDECAAPRCAKTTLHGYESIVSAHLTPALGDVPLRSLCSAQLRQYYAALREQGLASNTVRKHHVLLHTALSEAVRRGLLEQNAAALVVPPAREVPRHRYYDAAQLSLLLRRSEGSSLAIVFRLAGCLGLRRSEICGLKWRNVDLAAGVLTVCEVRTAAGGEALEKAPKSRASMRRLSFRGNAELSALLACLYAEHLRRRAEADYNSAGYVAVTSAGKPFHPDDLCRRVSRFVREQGLPPVSLHGLRHSFASLANSCNVPVFSISRALGHSSTAVTSAVYLHLFDDTAFDLVARVATAVSAQESAPA